MKAYNYTILILFTFLLYGLPAFGHDPGCGDGKEFEKNISKEFKASTDGEVKIVNRYGAVNIETWNENRVTIDVKITVKANDQERANEIFDRIHVNFENFSGVVSAETEIGSAPSARTTKWWKGNDGCGSCPGDNGNYQIDYEVRMPAKNNLDLYNKYGNAYLDKLDAKAKIEVKYGNVKVGEMTDELRLTLGYGNGDIGDIEDFELDMKYSKMDINSSDDMQLTTKYSKLDIGKAGTVVSLTKYDTYEIEELDELRNEGKYDNFRLGKINKISIYSKYSDIKMDELSDSGEFELRYGQVNVRELKAGFSELDMEAEYTHFRINLEDDNVSFELDLKGEYASMRYPDNLKTTRVIRENSSKEVKGTYGNGKGGKIKADLRYGGISID